MRSRVGTLAKQIKQFCGSGVPELPDEWKAPERETPIEKKLPKPRRQVDKIKSMPVLLAKRYQREKTGEISALSPQKTASTTTAKSMMCVSLEMCLFRYVSL